MTKMQKMQMLTDEFEKGRGWPGSVSETIAGAAILNPEKEQEILTKARSCQTPREAVKAMQPYLR